MLLPSWSVSELKDSLTGEHYCHRTACAQGSAQIALHVMRWQKHSKSESRSQNLFDISKYCFARRSLLVRLLCRKARPLLRRSWQAITNFQRERKRRPNHGRVAFKQAGKAWRRARCACPANAPSVMKHSMDRDNNKSKSVVKLFLMALFQSGTARPFRRDVLKFFEFARVPTRLAIYDDVTVH